MLIELGRVTNPTVLVVDDEHQILESLTDLLRRDYHVFGTDDVELALDILKTHAIASVLTDQRMPKTTGAELLARADTANVKFVFSKKSRPECIRASDLQMKDVV